MFYDASSIQTTLRRKPDKDVQIRTCFCQLETHHCSMFAVISFNLSYICIGSALSNCTIDCVTELYQRQCALACLGQQFETGQCIWITWSGAAPAHFVAENHIIIAHL